MKFANVVINGRRELSIKLDTGFLPLSRLTDLLPIPTGDISSIVSSNLDIPAVQEILDDNNKKFDNLIIQTNRIDSYLPCIENPGKIICIGLNYKKHAAEEGSAIPNEPIVFGKFSNSLAGHLEAIPIPPESRQVDYEGELGIVIGKKSFNVSTERALDYVFGYFIANDVSARDLQFKSSQWLLGKSCDKFAPIGPWIVTTEEIPNPNRLQIQTFVNKKIRQNSNTSDMIFSCDRLISYLSKFFTLLPGDIILTGTPEGVIQGMPDRDRNWLKKDDVVEITIERIGELRNKFY